jgi:hypothetical protein
LTRWCERDRTSRGGDSGGPFGVRGREALRGWAVVFGSPVPVRRARDRGSTHFRSGKTDGTPLSSGETEDRSLVETSRESGVPVREPPTRALGKALERRTVALPEGGGGKRRKEGAGKPVPRCAGKALERRKKPKRVSALFASARMGTDPRGEQRPEAAGHRGLLVLRAGERDAMNGKRATAPKGVRLREGETLCRVNPMSGTGPSGPECVGGSKPSRG